MIIELILAAIVGFISSFLIFKAASKVQDRKMSRRAIISLREQDKLGYKYILDGKASNIIKELPKEQIEIPKKEIKKPKKKDAKRKINTNKDRRKRARGKK